MTPRELQEQYLAELKPRQKEVDIKKQLPKGYIQHVRSQAATLTRLLNKDHGIRYIEDALKDWPIELEEELKRFNDQ